MKKLTFEEVMGSYEEKVNSEYEYPFFCSYYITDYSCDDTKENIYQVKCLWHVPLIPIASQSKNKNNKYILSEEQKTEFKNLLIETFNKESIYMF